MKTHWTAFIENDGQVPPTASGYLAILCAEVSGAEPPDMGQLEAGAKALLRERNIPFPAGVFMPVVTPDPDRHDPPDRPGWTGSNLKLWFMD
jgi:hypothetical protein